MKANVPANRHVGKTQHATNWETLKEMSTNRKLSLLALIALISFSLVGCGGGASTSSSTSSPM